MIEWGFKHLRKRCSYYFYFQYFHCYWFAGILVAACKKRNKWQRIQAQTSLEHFCTSLKSNPIPYCTSSTRIDTTVRGERTLDPNLCRLGKTVFGTIQMLPLVLRVLLYIYIYTDTIRIRSLAARICPE